MSALAPRRPSLFRRWFGRLLGGIAFLLLLLALAAGFVLWTLPDVTPLQDPRATLSIEVRDWQGQRHPFLLGPRNRYWTPLAAMPKEMKWAVIVAEDATFYEHRGVDIPALREAFRYNLEQKRLARGASTITQQLAKNVFLSREKSLWRKLRELLIARRLEQELSKERILELYLNVVELGPKVHGVGHGARHFFGKTPGELTPAECALLAAILPGPRIAYNPELKPQKVQRRAARILQWLQGRRVIDEIQYARALQQLPVLLGLTAPLQLPESDIAEGLFEEDWQEDEAVPADGGREFTGEQDLEPPAVDQDAPEPLPADLQAPSTLPGDAPGEGTPGD